MRLFDVIAVILVSLCAIGAIWYVRNLTFVVDNGPPPPPPDDDFPPNPTEPLLSQGSDDDWDRALAQLVESENASTRVEVAMRASLDR